MNEQQTVEKLIEKFRFDEPVQRDTRDYIALSKRRNLVRILKKEKSYGIFTGLAVIVYLVSKKLGMALSFLQSAAVTAAVTVITVTAVVSGGIGAIHYITGKNSSESIVPVETAVIKPEEKIQHNITPVSLFNFSGTGDALPAAKRATTVFYETLKAERGDGNVAILTRGGKGISITGSLEKKQNGFILTVKAVDQQGIIINIETAEIDSEDELNSACSKIARKISKSLK